MPTPPTGDIACAASPMQSRPGFDQRVSRSTATVSSLTSSHERTSSAMRAPSIGTAATTCRRKTSMLWRRKASAPPLGMTNAHCQ